MGLLSWLKSLFGKQPPVSYVRFRDNLGNFEIFYPKGWKYDDNIALVDGKYTISFESPDGRSQFTVSVDTKLPAKFSLGRYMKEEFESPSSGIYAPGTKTKFRGFSAYSREFVYSSGGRRYLGYGMMFQSGSEVFTINWTGPEKERGPLEEIFGHMLRSMVIREGMLFKKKKAGEGTYWYAPPLKET